MGRKKFKFRLQRVLEYREGIKKEKERELALKNAQLNSAESIVEDILSAQDGVEVPEGDEISMAELTLHGDYLGYLQEALVNQRLHVLEASAAVEQARDVYIEKAIEAKTLETLKKKKKEEFTEEKRRDERKQNDRLIVQRHRFNQGGPRGGNDE